jgi:hypothetical protein
MFAAAFSYAVKVYCGRTANASVHGEGILGSLLRTGVAVEKGTKAVISVNFSLYGRRTFNNLTYERILLLKLPKRSFSSATPVLNN